MSVVANVAINVDAANAIQSLNRVKAATAGSQKALGAASVAAKGFGAAVATALGPLLGVTTALAAVGKAMNIFQERQADVAVLGNGLSGLVANVDEVSAGLRVMADEFGKATLFNEEDFMKGAQMLTSFRDIAVSSYEDVINTAADVAQVMGTDVNGSLMQLAKALQDPIQGLSALSRSGIQFTETQKATIKSMIAAGDAAGAQAMILGELQTQYGGAAKAAGSAGFAGAMDTLGEVTRDAFEILGKALDPILTAGINLLTKGVQTLADWWSYIGAKVLPRVAQAVQPLVKAFQNAFASFDFDTIRVFLQGVLIKGFEGLIFIVGNLSKVLGAVVNLFVKMASNPVFKFIAEQVARLVNHLGLTTDHVGEFKEEQKKAAEATKQTAKEAENLKKQSEQSAEALKMHVAEIQSEIKLLQSNAQLAQKITDLGKLRLTNDLQRLELQKQFNQSLNQEVASVNAMARKKVEIAKLELDNGIRAAENAKKIAFLELDIVYAKYQAGEITESNYKNEVKIYQNKVKIAENDKKIAEETYKQNKYLAEIERKQKIVAEYAADYARQTEQATRALQEQSNVVSNRATVMGAISQATQTINNLEIQSLETELKRASNASRRQQIIEKIYELEIENAKVQLEATRANIQAELARADAAYRTVQLKYEELKAVVAIAQAEGVVTRAHFDALHAQESALRIAKDNLNTAGQVANWQGKAADAVFKAAVEAAKLKKETSGAAEAAGQFAGNMERAAGAMGGIAKAATALGAGGAGAPFAAMGGAGAIQDPGLKAQAEKIWKEAERFAATKGIASIQADILQRARDAIARIAFRDYVLQQKAAKQPAAQLATNSTAKAPASTNTAGLAQLPIAAGLSRQPGGGAGTAIVDSFPRNITVQTGPVLQQDNGEKYVSLKDLEGILQDFAATIFENSRTSGGRRYQGVS